MKYDPGESLKDMWADGGWVGRGKNEDEPRILTWTPPCVVMSSDDTGETEGGDCYNFVTLC